MLSETGLAYYYVLSLKAYTSIVNCFRTRAQLNNRGLQLK